MNKEFWMEKDSADVNDGDGDFSNAARIGPKRSHQWFVDTAEPELYPSKKQELQTVECKPSSEMLYQASNPWENTSTQFMDRLFGNETPSSADFSDRNLSSVNANDVNDIRKEDDNQFRRGLPAGLSVSHIVEDPEACLSYAGVRKVKVNQVKEYDTDITAPGEPSSNNGLSTVQLFNRESEASFVSIGQNYYKEQDSMALVGHADNLDNLRIGSAAPNYVRGVENTISMPENFVKADTNLISFGGFVEEHDIIPMGRPLGSYDQLCQPASLMSDTTCEKELDALNPNTILNSSHGVKPRTDTVSKNNPESKTRKRAPNSFPSNVRSLISTGMLDGVPVKYVSLGREELRGVIKGSGYLCGCQSCDYAKVLNAYEFERHAGLKTKHPNNHVYFENGKTIYQIVQELRNTPESLLFDTIQTVFGAPLNQKSFRIWKESFQAATRELQRIYGKEELNI